MNKREKSRAKKLDKNRILTETHVKIMIRDRELGRVFNKTELQQFYDLINKIKDFDRKEQQRNEGTTQ